MCWEENPAFQRAPAGSPGEPGDGPWFVAGMLPACTLWRWHSPHGAGAMVSPYWSSCVLYNLGHVIAPGLWSSGGIPGRGERWGAGSGDAHLSRLLLAVAAAGRSSLGVWGWVCAEGGGGRGIPLRRWPLVARSAPGCRDPEGGLELRSPAWLNLPVRHLQSCCVGVLE